MASCMASTRSATRAFRGTRVVTCAFKPSGHSVPRRAIVGFTAFLPLVLNVPRAAALLLDEDDEELIEKAKANRKAKLASQKQVTRQYVQESGIKDLSFESELLPVQKAVYKLAESGVQLENGNLSSVSSTLSEPWLEEFKKATERFPDAASSADTVFSAFDSLKSLAGESDLKGSKKQFVSLVAAVQTWATDAGVAFKLQGL